MCATTRRSDTSQRCGRAQVRSYRENGELQPDAIPIGIIKHAINQARAQGIGNDVPRQRPDIVLVTKRAIMVATPPYDRSPCAIQLPRHSCLEAIHDHRQRVAMPKLHESMPVVRHEHPAQQRRIAPVLLLVNRPTCGPSQLAVFEQWPAIRRHRCQEVDVAWKGKPSRA